MNFWIVEDGELVEYSRKGSCNKCGKCCCSNKITVRMTASIGPPDNEDANYDNWEGWSHHEGQGADWWWKLNVTDEMLDHECSSLSEGRCEIWGNQPAVCRYFPMQPRDIEKFPECGFRFEKE